MLWPLMNQGPTSAPQRKPLLDSQPPFPPRLPLRRPFWVVLGVSRHGSRQWVAHRLATPVVASVRFRTPPRTATAACFAMASSPTSVLYIAFLVQAVGALVTALAFSGFHRNYRKGYLHFWTLSWFALGVTELSVVRAMLAGSTEWYSVALTLAVVARMVQIGGLLLGG